MPQTRMYVIPTIVGAIAEKVVDLPSSPSHNQLRSVIEPHLDGQRLEHVRVLYGGEYRDMFVGENSAIGIRNIRATDIYHNNVRTAIANGVADPANHPEPWPAVSGPAVLFPDRIVWK